MLKELQDLLVVQDRDSALQKLQTEMAQIPKDVAKETAKLKTDEARLAAVKEELQQLEVQANKLKLDRRTRQDTMEKLKVQQFETKKNDEFAALGAEADRYQTMVSDLETEELEVLEQVDTQRQTVASAEEALATRKSMVTENINALKEKARQMVVRFKEAKVARTESTVGVDSSALGLYERVLKSKGDVAVVGLIDDNCTGCNMKVVAGTVSKVKAHKEIAQCENCGRLLFEQ